MLNFFQVCFSWILKTPSSPSCMQTCETGRLFAAVDSNSAERRDEEDGQRPANDVRLDVAGPLLLLRALRALGFRCDSLRLCGVLFALHGLHIGEEEARRLVRDYLTKNPLLTSE
ncbi:hypothetical protein ANCCAN_08983 [Ancylostoma caninum]|uniref:Uncharacterized protein n=1 Tax=Ancylostoma caninum TaxID=29170 RepID=A0A368GPS1_ANCCA|nr:hypothetical protein ANCCAN_08983 [Ancylostoma caninum]